MRERGWKDATTAAALAGWPLRCYGRSVEQVKGPDVMTTLQTIAYVRNARHERFRVDTRPEPYY